VIDFICFGIFIVIMVIRFSSSLLNVSDNVVKALDKSCRHHCYDYSLDYDMTIVERIERREMVEMMTMFIKSQ
jgi:hypothetical protein